MCFTHNENSAHTIMWKPSGHDTMIMYFSYLCTFQMLQIKDCLNKTFHLSLQKYRMYLGRDKNDAEDRYNLLAGERRNLSRDTLEEDFNYYHGHGEHRSYANIASWNPPSIPTKMDHPSHPEACRAGASGGAMLFRDAMTWWS